MSRILIKVCGITSIMDAAAATEAGASALGFVFWPRSPRAVDVATARLIIATLPPFVVRVGVFVDATREELARTSAEAGLDMIQLHGDEPPEELHGLPRRALKALRVAAGFALDSVDRYAGRVDGILLDSGAAGVPGGTGRTFDWSLAREVRDRVKRLVLAGGLTPDNVHEALAQVRPDAVDVSSGVETAPGRKNPEKLRAFVEAVRRFEKEAS
ncbi:MAG: phosphoribosylanthranilate isomerase [Vicinamibacteria bacterium]|nr:phosphoribosylanthranilate isomerase [Vicinamibacteria bacterium]